MPSSIWKSRVGGWMLLLVLVALPGTGAAGPWHAAEQNTSGWYYMTPDERIEHQRRMRGFKTYEECKSYQTEQHAKMARRALKEGVVLQPRPDSGCEQLRQRGRFE
ncbi:hypothetical protein [Thiohalophilus sp.]|uniref:hypothetical protein n=1 Tax=Thiohalophilus sp. TaxID=3028392 RepID=UPI002ACEF4EE|nr:hypothetical protein [Thiohalophilus sp.]MDZ7663322.1 hypothetical protein [Thiohalophilus sp.]